MFRAKFFKRDRFRGFIYEYLYLLKFVLNRKCVSKVINSHSVLLPTISVFSVYYFRCYMSSLCRRTLHWNE